MADGFIEVLHSWQNFYFMIGGASAGLMGLMFVALSLGMQLTDAPSTAEFSAFVTPSILYFVSALLVSSVMLVPVWVPSVLSLVLLLGGVAGLVRITGHVWQLIRAALRYGDFNYWDWLTQIILPVLSFGLILLAAVGFGAGFTFGLNIGFNVDSKTGSSALAFMALWLATLLLLICAISNTWSLVIWIIERRKG